MTSVISMKPQNTNSDEIELGRLLGELLDHYKLIISTTVLFTVIAIVYALFATPIYEANSLIQVEQKQGNALIDSITQMLPDSQPESATEIGLLQSRMVLGKTIEDLNLQAKVDQDYFPIFGKGWARLTGEKQGSVSVTRLYLQKTDSGTPKITMQVIDRHSYHVSGDGIDMNGRVGELLEGKGISLLINKIDADPGTSFTIKYLSFFDAIDGILNSLTVIDQGKNTGMLNLTLTGDDPILVKNILNSISENYLAQNVSRQAAQDAKSLEFLNKQLPQVRGELDIAEDKLNAYRKKSDSVDLSLEAKSALEQIVNVDNQLNELTFREAEISQLYTKTHPTYKALLEKRQTLEQEKIRLNQRVSEMPATQQEVLRLSRDVDSGQAIYMQLLNRQQELSIAESSAIGNVRIVDSALTQPKPVKPKKILVVLIGGVLGCFISMMFVFLKVLLHRGIESSEQLEENGVSVYANIPLSESLVKINSKNRKKRKGKDGSYIFLAKENPADLAIEAIRGLRTTLHFAMMEAKNNIVMISSSSPGAGKTFISSNMAALLSLGKQKVLFIDADMRKGYVHKLFSGTAEKGLSEVLSGQMEIGNAIRAANGMGFDYISRGMIPPNPSELLMHSRFKELMKWTTDNYDIVIIDTPPVLAVTDAALIGQHAGTSMLVARFEKNTMKEILMAIKKFEQNGINIKGCVLNGVVKKASSYYGYGYGNYSYLEKEK